MTKKRPSQQEDETAIEYLRRVVSAMNHEYETMFDHLRSTNAILDYFDLWYHYDTEFWEGIRAAISMGDSQDKARKFCLKHKLPDEFFDDIDHAVECFKEQQKEANKIIENSQNKD